mmetsp:Transcript_10589/g.65176  ORF Transcript_10589/g.65176 Transcript_10589/m.65176 type:complete len:312 (+) Transcript_10589:11786-12721(+)
MEHAQARAHRRDQRMRLDVRHLAVVVPRNRRTRQPLHARQAIRQVVPGHAHDDEPPRACAPARRRRCDLHGIAIPLPLAGWPRAPTDDGEARVHVREEGPSKGRACPGLRWNAQGSGGFVRGRAKGKGETRRSEAAGGGEVPRVERHVAAMLGHQRTNVLSLVRSAKRRPSNPRHRNRPSRAGISMHEGLRDGSRGLHRHGHGRMRAWPSNETIASRTSDSPPSRTKTVPLPRSSARAARQKGPDGTTPVTRWWTRSRPYVSDCLPPPSRTANLPSPIVETERRIQKRCRVASRKRNRPPCSDGCTLRPPR